MLNVLINQKKLDTRVVKTFKVLRTCCENFNENLRKFDKIF